MKRKTIDRVGHSRERRGAIDEQMERYERNSEKCLNVGKNYKIVVKDTNGQFIDEAIYSSQSTLLDVIHRLSSFYNSTRLHHNSSKLYKFYFENFTLTNYHKPLSYYNFCVSFPNNITLVYGCL